VTFKHGIHYHLRAAANGSLAAQAMWLLGSVACLYLLLAPLAYSLHGTDALIASAVAAAICVFGSLGALIAMQFLKGPAMLIGGVVLGMFLRMTVPLVFCMIVYLQPGFLTRAGMVFYVLAFYMVTLTVDAAITALRVSDSTASGEKLLNRNVQSHG
jgi:hypothetical protein